MWSLGLLAYSWLFLQTIGSAHFSRGMNSDRSVEPISGPPFHTSEIRLSFNFTGNDATRRRDVWDQPEFTYNHLIKPSRTEITTGDKMYVSGLLVLVKNLRTEGGETREVRDGCSKPSNPGRRHWIAVVEEGDCKYNHVFKMMCTESNASGVILVGRKGAERPNSDKMEDGSTAGVGTYNGMGKSRRASAHPRRLMVWVRHGVLAAMQARCNRSCNGTVRVTISTSEGIINRTSVLFVSISFILLMIISLAWLVFYYVQRFRYIHAKERLSRRLANAAKKALTRIPVKTLLRGDPETENEYDQCAVCIEQYKASDTIRILPCRHYFHKSCIDPWLLEQRSCPMCKLDILKAYGLQVRGFSEAPSDTLADHSDLTGLGGRPTSVSLETAGRDAASDPPDRAHEEADAAGGGVSAESRSASSGAAAVAASPSASPGGGVRVTIEPPEVQYHHPETTVEVVVEQHRPDEEEEEEEDEEAAASRPLVGEAAAAAGGGPEAAPEC